MKTTVPEYEIENYISQLLSVLDTDIYYLEYNLSQLNELRGLVVKQNVDHLHKLLDEIRKRIKSYQENNARRTAIRKKLSDLFNCKLEEVTLTWLATKLNGGIKSEIEIRKRKLQTLAASLKKEYAGTQLLLADCARFNRILLKSVFRAGRTEDVTYNPTGTPRQQNDNVFVNLEL